MTDKLGIIGVGHFASYLVEGFLGARPDMEITLSPRGKTQSDLLSEKFDCLVARDNQDVVDQASVIILSVRPGDLVPLTHQLSFRKSQTVITVASGVKYADIKDQVLPATAVRALPIASAAINQSPTLYYPESETARSLLSLLGPVYLMADEEQFSSAAVFSALYGWNFKFMEEMIRWGENNDLSQDLSRDIVEVVFSSAAGMATRDQNVPMKEIVKTLATKGGITELGLNLLDDNAAFDIWHKAMDEVKKKIIDKN